MGFGWAMTEWNDAMRGGVLLLAAVLAASPAAGQTTPTPQETPRTIPGLVIAPTPAAQATPVPVPTAPVRGLTLPAPAATSQAGPAVRATTAHRGVATPPTREAAKPAPPTPVATPSPAPTGSPPVVPAVASPTPSATPAASPVPSAASSPASPSESGIGWPRLLALVALIAAVAGWFLLRPRRQAKTVSEALVASPPPAPALAATPLPTAAAPSVTVGARLTLAFQPGRAGLNMLSAIVEGVAVVANTGDAPATDVRLFASLLSAHAGQEADLAAAFAAPGGRPTVPPFALTPGEERRVRIVAALPRDAMRSMEAAGRPMFVPLLALDARHAAGRTGQAFIVGIERVDSAKLAPFWLDAPIRMHDQVAARTQDAAVVD